jgi:hypothetical protein
VNQFRDWTSVPNTLRKDVTDSIASDVDALRDASRPEDRGALDTHADALEVLVRWLQECEPTIRRQRERAAASVLTRKVRAR